ncbi:DNA polymerase-1 [Constrictibacter sp. MBR-5]|uniref:DNA polymerase I n=1 Tax=Constrictibacter sp. MBR-5 TaxID=3156467 RepID=UPI0033948BE2
MTDTAAETQESKTRKSETGAAASERPTLWLIDGSGYIFRAFHALPPMTRPDGTPVNAVFGFCSMVIKLLDDMHADHVAVIFDKGATSFRNDLYDAYKANRDEPPDELKPQFGLIRDATRAFALPCIETEGFEADDIIATYARIATEAGMDVTIVSSDKDLMQLVGDHVRMWDPMKQRSIGPEEVRERFGVGPELVVDVQALAGDSVDNVPGVPGIGVKTGAQLVLEYGGLDALLERAHEIKQPKRRENLIAFADQARLSRDLVRLRADVPTEEGIDDFVVRQPDPDTLLGFLREQGFRSITARAERQLAGSGAPVAAPAADAAPPPPAEVAYTLVLDEATLRTWIDRAIEAGAVALSVKTTHSDPSRGTVCGIALALEAGSACYVPFAAAPIANGQLDFSASGDAPAALTAERAMDLLKPLLADPSVLKIGQNLKFDIRALKRFDARVTPVDDMTLLAYVLDGSGGLTVGELAERHFGHACVSLESVIGKGKAAITFDQAPHDRALAHAAEEVDYAARLHALFRGRLVLERMTAVYETIERPLVQVLADMEEAGVLVDPDQLRALSKDFGERMATIETDAYEIVGHEFNIGSPKQISDIIFGELGVAGGRKSKTGAFTTGADVLEDLAGQDTGQAGQLAQKVLDWRQISKLKSTYSDALLDEINPDTGRVHTTFAMAVTTTGRLSSNDPNLQNIPVRTEEGRKIRQAFVASPGHVLLSADYSQIELRLLAHVAEIESLRTAFREGYDIHAMTASQVFGTPVEGMDPQVRRKAKAINFGIIYGISAFGLGRQLGIPQGEARAYIDAYFERYPGIRDYMERAKSFAREHGHITTIFGRKCYTPYIRDKNPAKRSFGERAAINAPLQGSAADIIKRAMVRIPKALGDAGLRARMLLQVHDELLFEVPEAEAERTAALVQGVMERAASLSVPLVVDTGTGRHWGEAH